MTFQEDELLSFLGWDTLSSSLIEKVRYCAFIPRDKPTPLELHNECLKQLGFLKWCKTDPRVHQVVKDYVNQITFEKQYDQYVLDLKLEDSFYTNLHYTLWSYGSSEEEKYNKKDFEDCFSEFDAWYNTSALKLLKWGQIIDYKKFSIFMGKRNTGTTFAPFAQRKELSSKEEILAAVKSCIENMINQDATWSDDSLDIEYNIVLDNKLLVVPAKIEIESSVESVSYSSNRSVSVDLCISKKEMEAVYSLAGSVISAL